jgi:uncharacterized oxidoreductase
LPLLDDEKLRTITFEIFLRSGLGRAEAITVSNHLIESNLVGHDSHGVIRISQYVRSIKNGRINVTAEIDSVHETSTMALLNGNWGFGQVIAERAMNLAIEKADRSSLACVSVYNCNHIGRLGHYATMAAERDMVGIISVNNCGAGQVMAPYGGAAKRLSPNPISIGFPAGKWNTVLLDISSSVVAEGKVRVKFNEHKNVPEGWIMDASGRPTTDPADFYNQDGSVVGAIFPFGGTAGYKGFGLGFVLDVLCGALSTAGCSREGATRVGNALFVEAIKISDFRPISEFKAEVENLIKYVKSCPLAPDSSEILVPGEIEQREKARRMREGILVDEATWNSITEIAQTLGVSI